MDGYTLVFFLFLVMWTNYIYIYMYIYAGVALLATALVLNWELGLVMFACVPFIGASVAVLSMLMSSSSKEGTDHYGKAGGVATEVRVGFMLVY